jgi:hypothetical protein
LTAFPALKSVSQSVVQRRFSKIDQQKLEQKKEAKERQSNREVDSTTSGPIRISGKLSRVMRAAA